VLESCAWLRENIGSRKHGRGTPLVAQKRRSATKKIREAVNVQEDRPRRDRHGPARSNGAVLHRNVGFTVKARDRIERSGLGVPIDLVYLDLGGTVVELIS
jgi:hypothetical protein